MISTTRLIGPSERHRKSRNGGVNACNRTSSYTLRFLLSYGMPEIAIFGNPATTYSLDSSGGVCNPGHMLYEEVSGLRISVPSSQFVQVDDGGSEDRSGARR
jgi:hypothetical protein